MTTTLLLDRLPCARQTPRAPSTGSRSSCGPRQPAGLFERPLDIEERWLRPRPGPSWSAISRASSPRTLRRAAARSFAKPLRDCAVGTWKSRRANSTAVGVRRERLGVHVAVRAQHIGPACHSQRYKLSFAPVLCAMLSRPYAYARARRRASLARGARQAERCREPRRAAVASPSAFRGQDARAASARPAAPLMKPHCARASPSHTRCDRAPRARGRCAACMAAQGFRARARLSSERGQTALGRPWVSRRCPRARARR